MTDDVLEEWHRLAERIARVPLDERLSGVS